MGKTSGWRIGAALLGMVAILIGYFWVHKPLDPTLVLTLGGAALDVLSVTLIVSVAGGLGRRLGGMIAKRMGGTPATEADVMQVLSRPEQVALESLLGLGVIGWFALLLGLVGLYKGALFWLMLIVIAIGSFRPMLGWLRDLLAVFRRALQPENSWTRFLTGVIVFLLLTALLLTLAPPTAFDALNYHLVGPQHYLAAGEITTQPNNLFLGFPQGAEILYGVAMGLFGRETAAAPLHFAFGLLSLLAVGGLVRRYADKAAGVLAVALLLSALSIWLLFGWPYIDLAVMAYSSAAVIAVTQWRGHRAENAAAARWLVLTGLFVGLAIGVKFTAGGLALALLVYLAWNAPRQFIRNALIVGLVALAAFALWAVKGLVYYQNPVYPFIFGGVNWDAGKANTFSTAGMGLIGAGKAWQLLVMPVAATIFGVEKGDGFSFTAGPFLLTAPLLLLLGWRWLDARGKALARDCALLGLPLLAFWIVLGALTGIGAQTRLMMMGMPVVAAAAALGFHSLSRWPRKPLDLAFVARALVALTLVFSLLDAASLIVRAKAVPYLLAAISRDDYLTENLGVYNVAMNRLAELPDGSQVRLLFEPRTYSCPANVTCLGDILFDYWAHPLQNGAAPDAVFQAWKDASDDYVLVFNPGYDFNAQDSRFSRENALFPETLKRWMMPLWTDSAGGYTLYGWKS